MANASRTTVVEIRPHALRVREDPLVHNAAKWQFGPSKATQELLSSIEKVVQVDLPILLTGETGSGKEVVAQLIHGESSRREGPFVPVVCCALPSQLIQSELFGHEKGAFTGAHQQKKGYIEMADSGVLFLDEIGDLPADLQANLLRFLQEKSFFRVGGTREIPVDVRVVAATNVDLARAVNEGRFREDLFHRLNVLHIEVPTLRQRPEDIEGLAWHFFGRARDEIGQNRVTGFTTDALAAMRAYAWPGNVRELRNRVQRAVVMSDRPLITPKGLDLERRAPRVSVQTLQQARDEAEKNLICSTLRQTNNQVTEAARLLGVCRATLYRLMEKHNIRIGTSHQDKDG